MLTDYFYNKLRGCLVSNCPVCAKSEFALFTEQGGYMLWICKDCRHIWFAKRPKSEDLAAFYSNEYTTKHGQEKDQHEATEYYRSHVDELANLVAGSGEGLSIVDFGCSIPVFLKEAKSRFAIRVGIDLAKEAHDYGQQWGVNVVTPEQFEQSVPDASVDVIRFAHVLEHLIDPMDVFMTCVRKVRPGGLVYITQPNFPVLKAAWSGIELHDCIWPGHLHFFNPLSIMTMLNRAGVTMFRYATIDGDEDAFKRYGPVIDAIHAAASLAPIRDITEPNRGTYAGWPFYAGINLGCYGYKN